MKNIEAIIFDADGVTINFTSWYSEQFSEKYNVPIEKIKPFFEKEFTACLRGEADLKDVIQPYLKTWRWENSVDILIKDWHESENHPNTELLKTVKELRDKGIKCYLATNQEKYRAYFIAEKMGFLKLFDHCFFSCEMHSVKPELKFYEYVWESIQYMDFIDEKSSVMFWDDQEKNVKAARDFGFDGYVFESNESFEGKISTLLT